MNSIQNTSLLRSLVVPTLPATDCRRGDVIALEYELDFLEVRPYLFRSGYMCKDFTRVRETAPYPMPSEYDTAKFAYATPSIDPSAGDRDSASAALMDSADVIR